MNGKMQKIDILRGAILYIKELFELVGEDSADVCEHERPEDDGCDETDFATVGAGHFENGSDGTDFVTAGAEHFESCRHGTAHVKSGLEPLETMGSGTSSDGYSETDSWESSDKSSPVFKPENFPGVDIDFFDGWNDRKLTEFFSFGCTE
jgi:hypothetical protein